MPLTRYHCFESTIVISTTVQIILLYTCRRVFFEFFFSFDPGNFVRPCDGNESILKSGDKRLRLWRRMREHCSNVRKCTMKKTRNGDRVSWDWSVVLVKIISFDGTMILESRGTSLSGLSGRLTFYFYDFWIGANEIPNAKCMHDVYDVSRWRRYICHWHFNVFKDRRKVQNKRKFIVRNYIFQDQ